MKSNHRSKGFHVVFTVYLLLIYDLWYDLLCILFFLLDVLLLFTSCVLEMLVACLFVGLSVG